MILSGNFNNLIQSSWKKRQRKLPCFDIMMGKFSEKKKTHLIPMRYCKKKKSNKIPRSMYSCMKMYKWRPSLPTTNIVGVSESTQAWKPLRFLLMPLAFLAYLCSLLLSDCSTYFLPRLALLLENGPISSVFFLSFVFCLHIGKIWKTPEPCSLRIIIRNTWPT